MRNLIFFIDDTLSIPTNPECKVNMPPWGESAIIKPGKTITCKLNAKSGEHTIKVLGPKNKNSASVIC